MKKGTIRIVSSKWEHETWFTVGMWLAILTNLVLTAIHVFLSDTWISQNVFSWVHLATCVWFVFEMAVRILAGGRKFFDSRKNIFDLCMCSMTILLRVTTFGALRLLRGIFVDPTGAAHRDGASGTKR